jgi:hypothetical protein
MEEEDVVDNCKTNDLRSSVEKPLESSCCGETCVRWCKRRSYDHYAGQKL